MAKKSTDSFLQKYTPVTALAIAYEVYQKQGFVRSGMGYVECIMPTGFDGNPVYRTIKDNKSEVLSLMEQDYTPTVEMVERASKTIDRINGKMMIRKISEKLSSFENSLANSINNPLDKYHVSIIASIPHSEIVDAKREKLEDRMATLKHHSEFFGDKGRRYDIAVEVLDAKYIQSREIYMITVLANNRDIVKFWWRDQPDLCDLIDGKMITIRGTVNRHEKNKFNSAKETMLNRVSITSVSG